MTPPPTTRDWWYIANPDAPTGVKYSSDGGVTWGDVTGGITYNAFEIASTQPLITAINLSGTNVILNADYGMSNRAYRTLMSTNVTQPLTQWAPIATNLLSAPGNFAIKGKRLEAFNQGAKN